LSWRRKPYMEELLRMWRGREFQVVGAATAKLREPKLVRTRGTANKLQSDKRSLRDGTYCFKTEWRCLAAAGYRLWNSLPAGLRQLSWTSATNSLRSCWRPICLTVKIAVHCDYLFKLHLPKSSYDFVYCIHSVQLHLIIHLYSKETESFYNIPGNIT